MSNQPTDLWEAVSNNNLQAVQKILSSGSNIDLNTPHGVHFRYIEEARARSRPEQVKYIYNRYETEKAGNYLLQACLFSSPVVVGALVKAGANVNMNSDVICKATFTYKADAGRDIYERQYNATPLTLAVIQRNAELVKKLLHRCEANVNARNNEGLAPLDFTVNCKSYGNKYSKINTSTTSSMGTESTAQREQIFSLLVKAGATVNKQDIKGQTPLHVAVMEKDAVVARLLLQHHARVDIPNREGMTPLHMAARARDFEMCRLLIDDAGVDSSTVVNLAANDGTTPLHAAIMAGSTHIVNFFIETGADLTATKHHLTPLHLAAEYGLIDIVKLLVEAGADVNAETPNTGLTPLDMAEHQNNQDVIEYLTARQESETCERERNKREEPSVEKEEEEEEDETENLEEGAVGGKFEELAIKEE